MAKKNKTKPTAEDLTKYLQSVEPSKRSEEGIILNRIFTKATGEKAVLWGPSIVGYGMYHYKYDSGRVGDMICAGFSPRKPKISLYIMGGINRYQSIFDRLGKYKTGKSCVYINKLTDIDLDVLEELVEVSYNYIKDIDK
ncbi:MAG: DUF1801 domain-containing protein [Saprospiraceae bacterium]